MTTFDLYFSVIVGFQYHPANPVKCRIPIEDCAKIAAECMAVRDRFVYESPQLVRD